MISNCHLYAWRRFCRQGGYVCFRKTYWARHDTQGDRVPIWYRPIWALGVALQWSGSVVAFAGWLCRWRSWYHVVWSPEIDRYSEFVPERPDSEAMVKPPIVFKGRIKTHE